MTRTSGRRFTGGDILMERLGVNPPIQILWRLRGPLDRTLLKKVHSDLAGGPLNRERKQPVLPLARPLWSPCSQHRPLRFHEEEVSGDSVLDWADQACAVELDAHAGLGWELSAADLDDGTSVVSLVGSHALNDGQGFVRAIMLSALGSGHHDTPAPARPSLVSDLVDAATEGARTYGRLNRATRGSRAPGPPAKPGGVSELPPSRSRVAVTVSAEELGRIAEAAGSSVTSLVLAVAANTLRSARSTHVDTPFTVALPISFRPPDDFDSSNMVGIASVRLDAREGRYTGLPEIRGLCKAAYAKAGHGRHMTGYPQSDASLSNNGEIPPQARDVFGPTQDVLLRTVSGGGGSPGRMNTFVLTAGETVTLGFQASGVQVSREHVRAELGAWGVTTARWW